jgi:solute carrier family 35 (adenosine 3'-phospho 5'-phosphosulfate transporter), member B3
LIQGKRYGLLDLLAAILMSLGLIIFSLADSKVSPNFEPRGYIMISLALVADAIIGNMQEKAMKTHGASNEEVVSQTGTKTHLITIYNYNPILQLQSKITI